MAMHGNNFQQGLDWLASQSIDWATGIDAAALVAGFMKGDGHLHE